jgi:pimeloyl-ACP methyl ester carboxylesterase
MLAVRDSGSGPAVLLLHAFPCDGGMWDHQARALSDSGHRVIVPDLPGFGASDLPDDPPDLAVVVDRILSWLDDAGVAGFAVAGLSLGGYLAMAMLRRTPQRITRLMLIDTKASADAPAAQENRLAVAQRAQAEGDTEFLVPAMIPGLLGDSTRDHRPDVVARTEEWIRTASPQSIAWYQRAMAQRPDSTADLGGFPRPALVVYGEQDTVLSPRSEQLLMLRALPDARLVQIPAAGHLSAAEQPEAVAEALVGFLAEAL